jgi:hypothetical protein
MCYMLWTTCCLILTNGMSFNSPQSPVFGIGITSNVQRRKSEVGATNIQLEIVREKIRIRIYLTRMSLLLPWDHIVFLVHRDCARGRKRIQVAKPVIPASLNRCWWRDIAWNTISINKRGKKGRRMRSYLAMSLEKTRCKNRTVEHRYLN